MNPFCKGQIIEARLNGIRVQGEIKSTNGFDAQIENDFGTFNVALETAELIKDIEDPDENINDEVWDDDLLGEHFWQ